MTGKNIYLVACQEAGLGSEGDETATGVRLLLKELIDIVTIGGEHNTTGALKYEHGHIETVAESFQQLQRTLIAFRIKRIQETLEDKVGSRLGQGALLAGQDRELHSLSVNLDECRGGKLAVIEPSHRYAHASAASDEPRETGVECVGFLDN